VLEGEPVVTLDPRGCIVVNPDGNPGTVMVGQEFSVEAHFSGACRCCEYRQEIKGLAWVRRRGSDVWEDIGMQIGGFAELDRDDFLEDGKRWFRYGHRRGQQNILEDSYLPDRQNGCTYKGRDLPNIHGLSLGDSVHLDLVFHGRIIDVCTGKPKWEKTWRVFGYGFVDLEMSPPYLTSQYKFTPF
jgi:hypothetical protein